MWHNYSYSYDLIHIIIIMLGSTVCSASAVDYEDVLLLLQFTETAPRQCFTVRIIDDEDFEMNETFALALTSVDTSVIVTTANANVTIVSDDGKAIIDYSTYVLTNKTLVYSKYNCRAFNIAFVL